MANTHDARRLSKRAFNRRPGLMRITALIFMSLATLLLFTPFIPGFAIPEGWIGRLLLAGAAFLCCLTSLLLNGPAVAAARGKDARVFENFRFPRWLIAILLAAIPALLLGFSPELITAFSKYVDRPLAEYVKTILPDGFYSLYIALGGLFLIFLGALICLSWSVFTRQTMIYLFERRDRVRGSHLLQMMRSGLLNAFSPIRIWFSSLGWFILMALFEIIFILAARFTAVGWQEGMSLTAQLLSLLKSYYAIPVWLACAGVALTHLWILGLGFIFWPRYQLKRVYYQRMLMYENGMEVNARTQPEETE